MDYATGRKQRHEVPSCSHTVLRTRLPNKRRRRLVWVGGVGCTSVSEVVYDTAQRRSNVVGRALRTGCHQLPSAARGGAVVADSLRTPLFFIGRQIWATYCCRSAHITTHLHQPLHLRPAQPKLIIVVQIVIGALVEKRGKIPVACKFARSDGLLIGC